MKDKSNNKMVVALLAVLIIAVLGVGGYFIVKDLNKKNEANSNSNSSSQQADNSGANNNSETSNNGSTDDAETNEIEAGITYAEVRDNDFYVEAQINGQVSGTCDISVTPTDGTVGSHDTDDIEIMNKVSICDEDFSLKGMNPGEHVVKVIIRAYDGRTKTLEKTVNI